MASPSSVLTRGLGSWGSASLMLTRGLGSSVVVDTGSHGAALQLLPRHGAALQVLPGDGALVELVRVGGVAVTVGA